MKFLPSVVLFAVLAGPAWAAKPIWLTSYHEAYRQTQHAQKPLLVVLEKPSDADRRGEQAAANSSGDELLGKYTLCHIDVSTPYGQKIAESFEATEFPQTVIIDRSARKQIFRRAGRLSSAEWTTTLAAYESGEAPASSLWSSAQPRGRICFT